MIDLEKLTSTQKTLLHLAALVVGAILGTFIVFQVLFLAHVIPHGGI